MSWGRILGHDRRRREIMAGQAAASVTAMEDPVVVKALQDAGTRRDHASRQSLNVHCRRGLQCRDGRDSGGPGYSRPAEEGANG